MHDRADIEATDDLARMIAKCSSAYDQKSEELAEHIKNVFCDLGCEDIQLRNVVRMALIEAQLAGRLSFDIRAEAERLLLAICVAEKEEKGEGDDLSASAGGALLEALKLEGEAATTGRSDFARAMIGGGGGKAKTATRHILQALFNSPGSRPFVLVAQSRVASEGLNLHEACRHVLFLHLDWNPALIEQQIGRVDRLHSRWWKEFKDFTASSAGADAPRIEIASVVLEGTSDAEKRDRILARQQFLGAHLFGEVLLPEVSDGLKPGWRDRIRDATPRFSPSRAPIVPLGRQV